jgi:hypothetical protein
MLGLIVAVEAMISGRRADLVTPWADDWRLSARAAETTRATEADVLCFGDSLVKYGVLPNVIEARTGLKAYNLATSGGTMASSYFLFRRAIDSGAKPRAVVVDVAALMMLEEPAKPLNYAELGTWTDCVDFAWTAGDAHLFGVLLVGKLLPSFRWRFELRDHLVAALAGQSISARADLESFQTLWSRENGAQPTPKERFVHPQEEYLIAGVSPAKWACDSKERAYADRFFALAESHQIQVYWLLPPLSPAVHARRAELGSDARYDRFVKAMTSRHPATLILDARASGYDDSTHLDHLHLNRRGASVLSSDLANVVMNDLAGSKLARQPGPRPLPAFAGRTVADPTPTLVRSRTSRGALR